MTTSQSKSLTHINAYATTSIHQQILMDWQGFILESTDTIFSTQMLHHRPTAEWSHFFDSIFPVLQTLHLDSPEIYFPKIASVTNFLDGIYDCSFMRVEWGDNDKVLVWNIFDYSHQLTKIRDIQQRFNEISIRGIKK
jgi:hypothetical protein